MHQYVTEHIFRMTMKRLRPDNFTWGGLAALFEYLEEYEEDTGLKIEFDPIAICCEFSEYADFKEIQHAYGGAFEDLEDLKDRTQVIEHDDGIIIQDF